MKTHLFSSRKAQISTEILYSVGTMIIIFLLLTGVTFNRKIELRRTSDYLDKRDECFKIANTISSISSAGDNTARNITVQYNITVFNQSRIVVSENIVTPRVIEAVCTYTGNVQEANLEARDYTVINLNGQVNFIAI